MSFTDAAATCPLPLTAAQLGVWYAQRFGAGPSSYNLAQYVELRGPVSPELLETAIHRAERECGSFDLRFTDTEDGPRQLPLRPTGRRLRSLDLRGHADPRAAAGEWMAADRDTPLDLGADELSLDALLTIGDDHHLWYNRCHHLVADGYGCALLTRRVVEVYRALAAGHEPPAGSALGPIRALLDDDAAYQGSAEYEADREYWAGRFRDLPAAVTLARRDGGGAVPGQALRESGPLPGIEGLRGVARACRTTWTVVVVAAVAAYLHLTTGERDVTVGIPVSARRRASRAVPGMMANELPLRLRVSPGMTVGDLVGQAAAELAELLRHQSYPYDALRHELRLGGRQLFGVLVNILSTGDGPDLTGAPLRVEALSSGPIRDFAITLYKEGGRVDVDANPALYAPAEVAEHHRGLLRMLSAFADASAGTPLGRLVPAPSQPASVDEPAEAGGLWRRFSEVVARAPGAVAVAGDEGTLTYGELAGRAEALAVRLAAAGVRAEDRVALRMERSADLVVAILATIRAGAAYVPLDTRSPEARTAEILATVTPSATITGPGAVTIAPSPAPTITGPAAVTSTSSSSLPVTEHAGQLAYVMFTSGSTGAPKGVAVEHRAILDLARDRAFAAYAGHRVLHHSPQAFDASTYELWVPLLTGGTVVLAPPGELTVAGLRRVVTAHRVSALWLTAGLFRLVAEEDPACFAIVREVWTGGDVVPPAAVRRVQAAAPYVRVVDGYGPTETTTFATSHPITGDVPDPVPIGRPLDGMAARVLGPALNQVPDGTPGELYVAGRGLARGYLGSPALTAERFVADPYGPPGTRLYRTGDLATRTQDGDLLFAGRADDQVKIRGFRVEPGEIESALAAHPAVADAAVLARDDVTPNGKRLVGYVVPAAGPIDLDALREHLAARLPDFMIPTRLVELPELPITANGKLDRAALPAPGARHGHGERQAPQGPREELLHRLFTEVLAVADVGVDDGFFDLGGDSIATLQLSARAHKAGLAVSPPDIFQHQTVRALAAVATDVPDDDGDEAAEPALLDLDLDELAELEAAWEATR